LPYARTDRSGYRHERQHPHHRRLDRHGGHGVDRDVQCAAGGLPRDSGYTNGFWFLAAASTAALAATLLIPAVRRRTARDAIATARRCPRWPRLWLLIMLSPGATVARPLRADAARNLERVVGAATELFAEQGLEVRVEDIATRAGVGMGTLYRRFPNKDALIAFWSTNSSPARSSSATGRWPNGRRRPGGLPRRRG